MAKYNYYIAGRWRNKEAVKEVLDAVRNTGYTVYCFLENQYKGEKVEFGIDTVTESTMRTFEALPQDDPLMRKIFDNDMSAEWDSEAFILVLPAGSASHIEAGAAYGMAKPCYAVGQVPKSETLYCIFDKIFPDVLALTAWLNQQKSDQPAEEGPPPEPEQTAPAQPGSPNPQPQPLQQMPPQQPPAIDKPI